MQTPVKDEINYGELLKEPGRLFGMSFLYFLGILVSLGALYLWNMNSVGANAIAPAPLMDSSAFVQEIPLQTPTLLPPVDAMKAAIASDSLIARGREVFRGNCASCHGDNGQGDGPSAATLNPKPRNFHSLSGWTNGSKVSEIYKTLEEGIVKNGMASYGYLPPLDRFGLAHFIRSLAPGQPLDAPADLQSLETAYQLSQGKNVPGQIPVKKALTLVQREREAEGALVAAMVARAERQPGPAGSLFRTHAADPARVFTSFAGGGGQAPSLDEFVRSTVAAPANAGFRPSVVRLNEAAWEELHALLAAETRRIAQ